MKYIKLFENFNVSHQYAAICLDIHEICKKYNIIDYTINEDGSIDVDGDIILDGYYLKKLPIKFKNITGYFSCGDNSLKTLEGSPSNHFSEYFECGNNQLTSLEFCPKSINGDFYCNLNKLTSFKFMPYIKGDFYCEYNNIRDFKYFIEPDGNFYCEYNPIYEIWILFEDKSYIELLNDYDCIRGKDIIIDRLNEFLEEIDKPTVKNVKGYNNI